MEKFSAPAGKYATTVREVFIIPQFSQLTRKNKHVFSFCVITIALAQMGQLGLIRTF
jgi:hypothetical protein